MALLALLDPAKAQAQDIPRHRLDFAADRSLPKCDQALSFLGFITRWVPLAVFDPPHERELIVRLHRAPNGAKRVDVRYVQWVLDADGADNVLVELGVTPSVD